LLCLRNARAFPLLPAALASVPFGFVLVRVRVPFKCTCKYLEKYRRTSLSAVRRGKTAVGNAYDELCEETETLNLKSKS